MGNLTGKKVLLGVSGGIAAYKSCWLLRELQRAGAEVRVILTDSAEHFVSSLSLQALSGYAVRQSLFDEEAERANVPRRELLIFEDVGRANAEGAADGGENDDGEVGEGGFSRKASLGLLVEIGPTIRPLAYFFQVFLN